MDLTQEDFERRYKGDEKAVLLDVRTPEEWEQGIIPGAKMANIYEPQAFMETLDTLDKNKHYYVYCKAGGRSAQACGIMTAMGFSATYNLIGGFSEWKGDKTQP